MPGKLSGTDIYRFNRVIPGVGRFQESAGTTSLTEFRRRDGILTKLIENSQLDVIRMLRAPRTTLRWEELVEADRHERLSQVLNDLKLDVPMWPKVGELDEDGWDDVKQHAGAWLPISARARRSRQRYRVSMKKLRLQLARPALTFRELQTIDWRQERRRWDGSQADWNRMRAALSALLTWHLGSEYHPARVEVISRIPWEKEPLGPMPQATAAEFWKKVAATPEHARAAYVAMAVLGVYPSELAEIRREDLAPRQHTVVVNGRKTWARQRVVAVDARLWAWVDRAVPAPLGYGWLRVYWLRAEEKTGVVLPMKHLRHLSAQFAGDRGASDRDLTIHLGHSNPAMSHRYSRRALARGVAKQIADELLRGRVRVAPISAPAVGA